MEADVLIETYKEADAEDCCVSENLATAYILNNGRVYLQGRTMREV
jgi:hypothetical protein